MKSIVPFVLHFETESDLNNIFKKLKILKKAGLCIEICLPLRLIIPSQGGNTSQLQMI